MQSTLAGAARRRQRALADAATAAWVGARATAEELQKFVADLDGPPRAPMPVAAHARALNSMTAKLGVVSMDDYKKMVKKK